MWKNGSMTRREAYARLATEMGIAVDDCHIGLFDEQQCLDVIKIIQKLESDKTMTDHIDSPAHAGMDPILRQQMNSEDCGCVLDYASVAFILEETIEAHKYDLVVSIPAPFPSDGMCKTDCPGFDYTKAMEEFCCQYKLDVNQGKAYRDWVKMFPGPGCPRCAENKKEGKCNEKSVKQYEAIKRIQSKNYLPQDFDCEKYIDEIRGDETKAPGEAG